MEDRPAVIVAGGGPVGMLLALELGRRNVRCVLFNDKKGIAESPKANATSPRSMEHLRRLGIARKFRERSLPGDYPTDITYFTRDRKSTRLNSSHIQKSRMPSSA